MNNHDLIDALGHLARALHIDTPLVVVAIISIAASVLYAAYWYLRKSRRIFAAFNADRIIVTDSAEFVGGDTLFIMPDISGYSQFLSASATSAPSQTKHTIVSLLDALIQSVDGRLKVAKLEGDAVLFFAEAETISPNEVGALIVTVFSGFDRTKQLLIDTQSEAASRKAIANLDLKIIVHRGHAERFAFRNAVDLIGADVVLTYRLLKNSLTIKRYLMVTQSAEQLLEVPSEISSRYVHEHVPEFGDVRTLVYDFPDSLADRSLTFRDCDTNRTSLIKRYLQALKFPIRLLTAP